MSKDISHQGYPKIVTIVGAKYKDETNYMTAAWSTYLSHKPLLFGVSIAPQRYTHDLIQNSGEFNCNFLSYGHADLIHTIGRKSGANVNKIEALDLSISEGSSITTPYLSKSYAVIECKLQKSVEVGDHSFFVGEIVNAFGDENAFLENGIIDISSVQPALYLGSNTYSTTGKDKKVLR